MSGVKDEATVKMLEVNGINEVKILSRSNGIPEIKMSNGNGDIKKANGCQDRTQLVLPSIQSIDIVFKDIKYSVSTSLFNKQRKVILDGLSGVFKSGELTAIMGPSGAGKSSLLNVLSGFITTGIEGSVYANDRLLDSNKSLIKRYCAYMQQEDYLNPLFTVKEIMYHAASLKLSKKTGNKARQLLIEDILDSMAMRETCNTRCGQLSGGQKKRLNVCLELINNPSILYLDEPTSGLDSSNCSLLISKLKGLARSGRTVICTIHQPSAALFSQFDHLYLVYSGRTMYQGTTLNILPFLNCIGLTCPVFHNPADFVMDVINGEFGKFTNKLIATNNSYNWRNNNPKEKSDKDTEWKQIKKGVSIDDPEPRSEFVKYTILVRRMAKQLHRNWMTSYLKLFIHLVVGALVGVFFKGMGNTGDKVFSNIGYFFACILYISFTSLMPATLTFPTEMKILKKEHFNNWYKFTTYFLASLTVIIPMQLVFAVAFVCVSYILTNQVYEVFRYILFMVPLFFTTVISELIGLTMGTASSPVNGVFNGSIVVAILLLMGGFLVFLKHLSMAMYVASFIGFYRYVFELLVVSQYGYGRGKLNCPTTAYYCHFRDPQEIVKGLLGMSEDNTVLNLGILMLYTIIIAVLCYTRIRYKLKIAY